MAILLPGGRCGSVRGWSAGRRDNCSGRRADRKLAAQAVGRRAEPQAILILDEFAGLPGSAGQHVTRRSRTPECVTRMLYFILQLFAVAIKPIASRRRSNCDLDSLAPIGAAEPAWPIAAAIGGFRQAGGQTRRFSRQIGHFPTCVLVPAPFNLARSQRTNGGTLYGFP